MLRGRTRRRATKKQAMKIKEREQRIIVKTQEEEASERRGRGTGDIEEEWEEQRGRTRHTNWRDEETKRKIKKKGRRQDYCGKEEVRGEDTRDRSYGKNKRCKKETTRRRAWQRGIKKERKKHK